nr:MAG TPA: hypothetical protein [Caudoviricetes sp.]
MIISWWRGCWTISNQRYVHIIRDRMFKTLCLHPGSSLR